MGYRNVIDFDPSPTARTGQVTLHRPGMSLTGTLRQTTNGGRLCAAIRPDDITIGPERAVNTVPGCVANVEYCGRDSMIDVSVPGGVMLHVRASSTVALGDKLQLSVPPERVLVYAADA